MRPDFEGAWRNLYFDDVLEGPGAATPSDIAELYTSAKAWVSIAKSDPTSASVVVHCGAGISRSAAVSLMLLTLYFGNYQQAVAHLLRTHSHVVPNATICRLIFEKLGPSYGVDPGATLEQIRHRSLLGS